ncbi:MAG: phosphodiester glycosidase family protein [Defluviitaleaceae bacterium]|nr:phosphodiester glycosidase family protein [Defluviitaleaceae bacterium]
MRKKILKGLLHTLAALTLVLVFFMSTQAVVLADVIFYRRETYSPHPGITHERVLQMTERGMLDIHVLIVPLDNPYIYVGPVASDTPGLRETTTNLLSGTDAIAGINADFFGMAGNHSVHFGSMIMDGDILGLNPHTNHNGNEFATLFLDNDNNPFIEYMRTDVRFYNNGVRNIQVAAFNVVGHELNFPIVIDSNLMANTQPLMDRFRGLTKVVVRNNSIVEITRERVEVPWDGHVLIIPSHMRDSHVPLFSVGDTTRLRLGNNIGIDFSRIQMAIGGGGVLVSEGQTVHGAGVAPNARHPRSAVGITRDGNTMILMVVDGRNHSIGATNHEMSRLLRSYGAWDGMHFDGGGSSTMAVRQADGRYSVVNTPSDGAQRRIINALGVFDTRPFVPQEIYIHVPQLAELRANPSSLTFFSAGQTANLRFSGVATTGDLVPTVPVSAITEFRVVPPSLGTIENGVFTAGYGSGYIVAYHNNVYRGIPVTIGGTPQVRDMHRGSNFIGYPSAYVSGQVNTVGGHLQLDYSFSRLSATQAAHANFYPAITLPAGTVALNLEVRGDNSGHWLRGRIRDGSGRHHIVDFAASINFSGWQSLNTVLPANLPGPLTLDRIYAVALQSSAATDHTLSFNRLETIVAPPAPTNVPRGPVFRDWLWAPRGFSGIRAGNDFSFNLPYSGDTVEYSSRSQGAFSITTMTLYGRRLCADQWRNFRQDAVSSNPSYVVILMDDNPLRGFRHSYEFELFHYALTNIQNQGRMVFVVSNTGSETTAAVRDGIRYINLAQSRSQVHFRVSGSDVWWTD